MVEGDSDVFSTYWCPVSLCLDRLSTVGMIEHLHDGEMQVCRYSMAEVK